MSEQLGLFSAPVQVKGTVRKDGTVVKPHTRIQKVALHAEVHGGGRSHEERAPRLHAFVRRHGGPERVAEQLGTMSPEQRAELVAKMAALDGGDAAEVSAHFAAAAQPATVDLFGAVAPARASTEPEPAPMLEDPAAPAPIKPSESGPFGVRPGTSKARRREINAEVVDLLKTGRGEFTADERALMAQYSGNGGCGDSLNEFYTDPDVASAMWKVLASLGVGAGAVLEPSCATGVFIHTAPTSCRVTGVELDPVSSGVAQVLHGDRAEVVNASLERFARQDGDRQFDAVIGNVPFGLRGSLIKDDKRELKTAEGYFLDTALDKTRPGGIVALVVPTGVMDAKSNRSLRQRLLSKGEFLGAMRMPNTAFEHSHTDVTTDIVVFRKRADDAAGALGTLKAAQLKALGVWDDEFLSGGYFAGRGARHIFGSMEPGWRAKAGIGQDITVSGSMQGVPGAIAAWEPDEFKTATPTAADVVASLSGDEDAQRKARGGALKVPYGQPKVGDTKVVEGITYILEGEPPRWHAVDQYLQDESVTSAQAIASDIGRLLDGDATDREKVEEAVRAWVERYGIPSKNKNLMIAASTDRGLYRLVGAVKPDGSFSDVVTGRATEASAGSVGMIAQAMAMESDTGAFTAQDLAKRAGKDVDQVEDLMFASPDYAYLGDGRWTTMDVYLTGELWPKLDAARTALGAPGDLRDGIEAKYKAQAERLEQAIDPKSLEDVEVMLNSAFVPLPVIAEFFNEQKRAMVGDWAAKQPDMQIDFHDGLYRIRGGLYNRELLGKYLNRTGVKKDDMPEIDRWNREFKEWLLSSPFREEVEDLYNRKFRGFVQRDFSDATIDIPGMNTDGLKQYQYSGLRWALAAGKGIIAADVGLGKTARGLMVARMAKITGEAKRPTFIVPKSVLANWVAEADKWFPGSRVLVIGETYSKDKDGNLRSKADTAAERNRKLHDMTQNDYDFVFISQPAFNDIDLDPVTKGQYVNDDFWVQRGDALGNAGDKRLNKIREAYNQAIANREFQKRTDAIHFNDLGIDMLMVDESHAFKNLYAARARFGETPKFLGGQGLSNRALDMQMKSRWVREHNGGKGVFMLTATPTKNSPLEIYSMLSHIAPEAFDRIGIRNSEEFLDRFCEFKNDRILGTDGTIQDALVTVGFKNLGELREIMRRYIDRKTAADVGLQLPARDDHMHLIDMTPEQQAVYAGLREDLAESASKKDATGDAHIFSIMDKMAKAAMDLELLDPQAYAGSESPKYAKVAENVLNGAKDGGQVVFADSVGTHYKLRKALIAAGMKPEEIAIMNATEAPTSAKRQNIADDFNAGKLKVVIGNTATMGEGQNLQKWTADIHHMDLPWEPASMQQRNGRGLRQGNTNASVRIHTYLSKGSFDGYRYQSMTAKKDWQDVLWNGGDKVENLAREGVFSRDDLMIMLSADPEAERAKVAANKAAAQEKYDGERRVEAASEFVRFQSLKRSLGSMKNRDSATARRLEARLAASRRGLENNPYFTAKGALDSNDEVLISPATGSVISRNMGIEVDEPGDAAPSRWVVTGVSPVERTVSMRRYADTSGSTGVTVPLSKLADGVREFAFDQGAESAEVKAIMEEAAKKSVASISSWNAVTKMPPSVLAANYDLIQRQLKDGAKSYSIRDFPYGTVPMINRATGELKMAENYEHAKLHDTHDYLLPTEDAKEKAIRAWIDARRNSRVSTDYVQRKKGAGSRSGVSDRVARRLYADAPYSSKHINPFRSLMQAMSGGASHYGEASPLEKEARARLAAEQMRRIKRAPSASDAVKELLPLARVTGRSGSAASTTQVDASEAVAKYPREALMMAWARARHLGQLDAKINDTTGSSAYAFGGATDTTVHGALIRMARASGFDGLAEAFADTAEKHGAAKDDAETLRAMTAHFKKTRRMLEQIKKLGERMGIMDTTLGQLRQRHAGLGTEFSASDGYYDRGRNDMKFGDQVAALMENAK